MEKTQMCGESSLRKRINSDHYFNYFCPPCDTLAFYSFDYGNAHIIALNSETEAMLDSPEQFEWLVRDLEDNLNCPLLV